MASICRIVRLHFLIVFTSFLTIKCNANDILGCGGFVKSHVKLDFSEIEIGLYTKEGSLKEKTECAPTNGYYFLPLYEKGDYVLKVHPPAGLSFEPSQVDITVDGATDRCSTGQDINFSFNGFGINGKVVTAGQKQGPSGVAVQLIDEKGEKRNTVTTVGGDFHFSAVIPGKYTVKASHSKWKLEPSQVEVQMKEGKMALPMGVVLTVKGYDVSGSVTSFGSPIQGLYVLLYSKVDPKFRVEGCNTALLQGVPDSPICHVTTSSSGEFTFGVVPAGEYQLVALPNTPGKAGVTYNVRPDAVPFTVRHDSLFINNAFEVTGFTIIGLVEAKPGKGLGGARVSLDGTAVGKSDAEGKFTLAQLPPGVYTVTFEHEECKIPEVRVVVEANSVRSVIGRVSAWRVCGTVSPAGQRRVTLAAGDKLNLAQVDREGKWCALLPPGLYDASVEVSQDDHRDGMQFYPVTQKVSVSHGPVSGVTFSQLKAKVSGTVQCAGCDAATVTLRPLSPDGGYVGTPVTAQLKEGRYTFSDVTPGSVEVSVWSARACWADVRHNVPVSAATATVPPFKQTGYLVNVHSSHEVEVEYTSTKSKGVLKVPRGSSAQCVPEAALYTLTPRSCHLFTPDRVVVDTTKAVPDTVYLVATAHSVGIQVTSPDDVKDLTLTITRTNADQETVGPLTATQDGGMFVYEHTIYLADGEVSTVSAQSPSLVFQSRGTVQAVGRASCQPRAVLIRALRALTLVGKLLPSVEGVTITLHSDEGEIASHITSSDGTYRFGPLDASKHYRIEASKESYIFSEPDAQGNIKAQKLAEIVVELVDDSDGTPLQGALVSVSGGSYRRNVVSRTEGARFAALSAGQYYVKPNMKEYRFTPPHAIVDVEEGRTHQAQHRGVRVAWSCHGSLVSLAGAGWGAAGVAAVPIQDQHGCNLEEATTEHTGTFRIRGLLPDCEYKIILKESSSPELAGLKLARAPAILKVVNKSDIVDVRLVATVPAAVTDATVLVKAAIQHYKSLRLTVAPDSAPHSPLYSSKVDAAGFTAHLNPGVMYVLPRLPADNKTYVVKLESSLPRAQGGQDLTYYFTSDGGYKHIDFEFAPKIKSTEQETRHSFLILIPVLLAALVYKYWDTLYTLIPSLPVSARPRPRPRPEVLDAASIDHILTAVNAAGKKSKKKN